MHKGNRGAAHSWRKIKVVGGGETASETLQTTNKQNKYLWRNILAALSEIKLAVASTVTAGFD